MYLGLMVENAAALINACRPTRCVVAASRTAGFGGISHFGTLCRLAALSQQ
jgi:hypothetical protein